MAAGGEVEAAEEVRVLSDGVSGEVQAAWVGVRGSSGDGDDGGVLEGGRASLAAAQFDGDEVRPKTLDGEMRRRKGSGGAIG